MAGTCNDVYLLVFILEWVLPWDIIDYFLTKHIKTNSFVEWVLMIFGSTALENNDIKMVIRP